MPCDTHIMDAGGAGGQGAPAADRPGTPSVLASIASYGASGVSLSAHAVECVLAQAGEFALDVVVVDDGSGPVVTEAIRASTPGSVSVVARSANRGYAAACNEGIRRARAARADYVWLLNNDIEMQPATLQRMLETIEERPGWAAVAPVTIDPRPPHLVLGAGVTIGRTRARVRHLLGGRPQTDLPREPYAVEAIEGAAPLVRLSAIDAVGELDEGYRMYWEDTDWSVRARAAGWQVGVEPRALVSHLVSQSTSGEQRTELMIANRVRFADRTGSTTQRLLFRVYFVLGWLPLYTAARLLPRFGLRSGTRMAFRLLARAVRQPAADEQLG